MAQWRSLNLISIRSYFKMQENSLIAKRAQDLEPSLTLEISAKAKALQKAGRDICSLSAGEPDFSTPEFIVEATIKALREGCTRYGPAAGDPELREAIARKQVETNKTTTSIENVMVTNGGKQAIYNLFQIILNPGDEVLIPSPYWLSYPQIASLAGAIPIIIKSKPEEGFKINIDDLESNVTSKTRLIIINTPSNPSGKVMSLDELCEIANFLRRHPKILLMSDEIYEFLIDKDQKHYSFAAVAEDISDRIFTVNGFAKAWAMTGWRVGYLIANKKVIDKCIALQSQSTSNVCSFAQKGALAALNGPKDCVYNMAESYNQRREILTKGLLGIKGIYLSPPKGAFYAFPEIKIGNISSIEFCRQALERVDLAIVPGEAFGESKCVRISCAVSPEVINIGIEKLIRLINQL